MSLVSVHWEPSNSMRTEGLTEDEQTWRIQLSLFAILQTYLKTSASFVLVLNKKTTWP